MRHSFRLMVVLIILALPVQVNASDEFGPQVPINQLLLSQKVTTLLDENMDVGENWVFDGIGGVGTSFEDGKFSLRWLVGNDASDNTPAQLLSSLPISVDNDLEVDELRLTVVYTAAFFGIPYIEDDFVNTGQHFLSYGNIRLNYIFSGLGLIGSRVDQYQFPLVIKIFYDISSGNQKITVNERILSRFQGGLTVDTNYVGPSAYSFSVGQGVIPTGPSFDSGFVQIDSITLEALTD